jgi:hypothetical protein
MLHKSLQQSLSKHIKFASYSFLSLLTNQTNSTKEKDKIPNESEIKEEGNLVIAI